MTAAETAASAAAASGAAAPAEDAFQDKIASFEGRTVSAPTAAHDPVNQPMIRHWVEAMGDENPVYIDEAAGRANGFDGVIAPPTMLQAWIMRGLRATQELERARAAAAAGETAVERPHASAQDELFALLDTEGFTSVVATDCEQSYRRPLRLGDQLTASAVIEAVSPMKRTGLGEGHFVTTRTDVTDGDGALVATMRFRVLKFRPRRAADQEGDI